ncbi:SCO6880 family protein [Isoptericola rhizosphaerae]|uniref:SCO6880 family protein n=1 Tax=Isoptericola rhizosphaerae TaxID=3377837 RepID=UPI00383AFD1E
MSEVIDRRVMLGGETRSRGIVAGPLSGLEWAGLALTASPALAVLFGGPFSWPRMLAILAIAALAVGLWTPFPGIFRGRSIAALVAGQVRFLAHRGVFVPASWPEAVEGVEPSDFTAPAPVGNVRATTITLPTGNPLGVLLHSNQVPGHAYTVAFEMMGSSSGLETEWAFGAAQEAWGNFCAKLVGRPGSHLTGVQEVTRIVPYDTADHSMWIGSRIPKAVDPRLAQSYVELLDYVGGHTEQHRSWLVLRLPITTTFNADALRLGQGEEGRLRLVSREVTDAMDRARDHGLALRPLDEKRLGAVLRALQDPDYPIDQVAGRTFDNAWLPWDARARRHTVVKGQADWYTRTARVPLRGIEAGVFPADFLHPLLSGVSPSVVRTISTTINLVPAHRARDRAHSDVTKDTGSRNEAAGRVSDGSEAVQLSLSQQRLDDLRPGTGHHGANWGLTITLCARSEDELDAACRRVEGAAGASHITELEYLDGQQDGGLVASLPLGRGLKG